MLTPDEATVSECPSAPAGVTFVASPEARGAEAASGIGFGDGTGRLRRELVTLDLGGGAPDGCAAALRCGGSVSTGPLTMGGDAAVVGSGMGAGAMSSREAIGIAAASSAAGAPEFSSPEASELPLVGSITR